MTNNKVMLQRAYAWITTRYPDQTILTLLPEVLASYMAAFAQEQLKEAERKAFQAGWEGAIDTYESGQIRGYQHEDFEKYKEVIK